MLFHFRHSGRDYITAYWNHVWSGYSSSDVQVTALNIREQWHSRGCVTLLSYDNLIWHIMAIFLFTCFQFYFHHLCACCGSAGFLKTAIRLNGWLLKCCSGKMIGSDEQVMDGEAKRPDHRSAPSIPPLRPISTPWLCLAWSGAGTFNRALRVFIQHALKALSGLGCHCSTWRHSWMPRAQTELKLS